MIYVQYNYFKKSVGEWVKEVNEFDSPYKAVRFIRSIKRKDNYIFTGYRCDSIEENEYIWENV